MLLTTIGGSWGAFDDIMRSTFGASTNTHSFTPEVDVRQNPERLLFEFDVPGVKQDALEVTVNEGILTVRGSRKYEAAGTDERLVLGRSYGKFSRSYSLPDGVDPDKLEASLVDGVLRITIPKRPETKPRRIQVTSSAK